MLNPLFSFNTISVINGFFFLNKHTLFIILRTQNYALLIAIIIQTQSKRIHKHSGHPTGI